jgi:F-type H+-transporting ATPase subunit b
MPQFDPTWFATQLFWLAITFIALYWILTRKILPRMGATIDQRASQIAADLQAAEAARAQAGAATKSVEETLARTRSEALALIAAANQEAATEAGRRQAAFAQGLAVRTGEAEARIAALREGLRQDVRAIAAEAAGLLAAKLTGIVPDPAAVDGAVAADMKGAAE